MARLPIPAPFSGGILLSYRCTNECRHCMYACSPRWGEDWISLSDAEKVLTQLAETLAARYPKEFRDIGINLGVHFTGGEPFLNFDLLARLVNMAGDLGVPGTFVETNCFWCIDNRKTEEKLLELREAGLMGILISVNPFTVEQIPFERIGRAVRIGRKVFGRNAMVYHELFYSQLRRLGVKGILPFEDYLRRMTPLNSISLHQSLSFQSILPMGRAPYRLGHLYRRYLARRFFDESCREELTRDWHIHIDNYCNYIPGYCAGISLGDARDLASIIGGISLDAHPIIDAVVSANGLGRLFNLAVEGFAYKEREEGYISKCHLCIDIRRHIAKETDAFKELQPRGFYNHIE